MTKAAVVILNWNGVKFLKDFLPSVINNLPDFCELIVADNQSTDDSVEYMKKNHPDVRLIINDSNGGFAKGYNDCLKQVEAEYYILLNSDIEVKSDWISPVIDLMEKDPSIGIAQPKLLCHDHQNVYEYSGAAGGYIDFLGFPFCRGRIFSELEEDKGQYNDEVEIFWASGAAMFVRSELYHKLEGFDEDFFAHMEEIDFCWGAKNQGNKVMYCPKAEVFHVGGGTLPKHNPRKPYLNFRNNLTMLVKNLPSKFFLPKLFLKLILDGVAGLKFLAEGDPTQFYAVIRAHFAFYSSFGSTLRKRKALNQLKNNSNLFGVYNKSIVLEFYLRGKKKFSDLKANF